MPSLAALRLAPGYRRSDDAKHEHSRYAPDDPPHDVLQHRLGEDSHLFLVFDYKDDAHVRLPLVSTQ